MHCTRRGGSARPRDRPALPFGSRTPRAPTLSHLSLKDLCVLADREQDLLDPAVVNILRGEQFDLRDQPGSSVASLIIREVQGMPGGTHVGEVKEARLHGLLTSSPQTAAAVTLLRGQLP